MRIAKRVSVRKSRTKVFKAYFVKQARGNRENVDIRLGLDSYTIFRPTFHCRAEA